MNPELVVTTGATKLRSVFGPEQLPGVILAYMEGIKATFAMALGIAGVAFLLSLFCPWKRILGGPPGEVMTFA